MNRKVIKRVFSILLILTVVLSLSTSALANPVNFKCSHGKDATGFYAVNNNQVAASTTIISHANCTVYVYISVSYYYNGQSYNYIISGNNNGKSNATSTTANSGILPTSNFSAYGYHDAC